MFAKEKKIFQMHYHFYALESNSCNVLKVFPVVLVRNAWAFLNSANLRTIVLLQLLTSSLCEQTACFSNPSTLCF